MEIAKMTSKGQITLPISIRRKMGLDMGDQVAFVEKNGEFYLVNASRLSVLSKSDYIGNIEGVIASMNFEGFDVSEESRAYMKARQKGEVTVEERIAEIKRKYARH